MKRTSLSHRIPCPALGAQEAGVVALLQQEWERQVTNPMRVELPSHPLLIPFRQGIQNISLKDEQIVIEVVIE